VRQGIAPQSRTAVVFSGPLDWTPGERWALDGVAQVLEVRLREALREQLGGTYSVAVSTEASRVPRPEYRIRVEFGSDPGRAAELTAATLAAIADLRHTGPTPAETANWKTAVLRRQELALRENDAWAAMLAAAETGRDSLADQLDPGRWLTPLTPARLREAAERYLDLHRYVRVTLLPAEGARP
jgi:zinc protease